MTYRIALGTGDGVNVTEHFGQCAQFTILDVSQETGEVVLVEEREVGEPRDPDEGCSPHDAGGVHAKIEALADCQIVLVAKIGGQSEKQLLHQDMIPLQYQGSIEDALTHIKKAYRHRRFTRKD